MGRRIWLRLSAYIRRGDDYLRVFRICPTQPASVRDRFMRRAVPDIADIGAQSWETTA